MDTFGYPFLYLPEFLRISKTTWDSLRWLELRLPPHSTSGRCLSFDYQAAGYVLGECSISVVLKPYAEKAVGKHAALCRFVRFVCSFFLVQIFFWVVKLQTARPFIRFWSGFETTVRSHNVRGIFATTKLYLQRWRFGTKRICRCGILYVCMDFFWRTGHGFMDRTLESWQVEDELVVSQEPLIASMVGWKAVNNGRNAGAEAANTTCDCHLNSKMPCIFDCLINGCRNAYHMWAIISLCFLGMLPRGMSAPCGPAEQEVITESFRMANLSPLAAPQQYHAIVSAMYLEFSLWWLCGDTPGI